MDKRYQVFISSTYQDLQEERQEVIQALLELDCIPSGMELFPAANDDQWTLIKKVIDDSDYYMVIIGGRYGSIGPEGLSFTEMEYRYAVSCGKPVIAFLHKNPGELSANRTEKDPDSLMKLNDFRNLAQNKLVKYWTTPFDLGSMVSRSLIRLIKTNPAVGWVRADQVSDESSPKEILRLHKQVEELEKLLAEARTQAPHGSENLAQGIDELTIKYSFVVRDPKTYKRNGYLAEFSITWNELFSRLAPFMIDESDEQRLLIAINDFISESERKELKMDADLKGKILENFEINESDFQTILIQFRALGLILKSNRQRSVRDKGTYWSLTPYGNEIITNLRAIRRE